MLSFCQNLDIIYNVKRGRTPLTRPKLESNTENFNPAIVSFSFILYCFYFKTLQ